ncbi:ferredoxin [Amycolatopsis taiwanensis]|uniref:Ferredoxin n=1 Tax=Amycolatopsis taiwanensis TaxID=342230 RepID=A0A9W6R828_9PSEU|nr:ferredoxin [Amycolatopsis taiwanensis]GLY70784.1 ferredoxin [Amycolatopsis taiwanensis]
MRVQVDLDRCEANGLCVLAAPEVFDLDDNDQLQYDPEPGEELILDVEDAARSCPVQAIALTRTAADGGEVPS